MSAPERLETRRLVIRKPVPADAQRMFARYSADAEVTKYLGWPGHQRVEQAETFIRASDSLWRRCPAGPYVIESRGGELLGSTGLLFERETVASTGYVLARDAWGQGYATEALTAMVETAQTLGVTRLYALCHPAHAASLRVLEKCGFALEERLPAFEFPNLEGGQQAECLRYVSSRYQPQSAS